MTWVLVILTGMVIQGNAGGAAATHVPGFRSEAQCIAAGEKIKADARRQMDTARAFAQVSASCVVQ